MKRWEMSKGEREAWDEDQLEIDRRKAGKAGIAARETPSPSA